MTPPEHRSPLSSLALLGGAAMAAQALIAVWGGADALATARLFLTASSFIFVPLAWAARHPGERKGSAFAAASIVFWFAMALIGFFLPEGWPSLLLLFLLTGASAWGAAAAARSLAGRRPGALEGAAFVALVLYCCGTWWSTGHTHPNIDAHLAKGYFHIDALYITANSALIRGFGKVALGIDGLTTLRWHYLTSSLLAAAGKLANAPQLTVHAVFFSMFAPPLYALGMTALAARFARARTALLSILVVGLAGWLLPTSTLGVYAAWDPIASETFVVALALFFIGALRQPLERESAARSRLDFLLDCAWIVALTLAKVSVGFLAAGWLTLRRIQDGRLRLGDLFDIAILWLTFGAVLPFILGQSSKAAFHPLWFLLAQIGLPTKWPAFFIVHWLPMWVGVGAVALHRRDWFAALRADRYFMTLIAPAWVVGFAFFNFTIRGGSNVYFSMLAPIFAIPWSCARLLEAARTRPRAGRAALAAVIAAAALFQLWPNASGLWTHAALRRIDPSKSPESTRAVESMLSLRGKLSTSPRCALHVPNRSLAESPLNNDVRCFEVPFYYTAILERPLIMSWMPFDCRNTVPGFWWGHPQTREQTPDNPTDDQLCAQARLSGLSCVELMLPGDFRRLACP